MEDDDRNFFPRVIYYRKQDGKCYEKFNDMPTIGCTMTELWTNLDLT